MSPNILSPNWNQLRMLLNRLEQSYKGLDEAEHGRGDPDAVLERIPRDSDAFAKELSVWLVEPERR